MGPWVKIKDAEAYANLANMLRADVFLISGSYYVQVFFTGSSGYFLEGAHATQGDAESALRDLVHGTTLAELID